MSVQPNIASHLTVAAAARPDAPAIHCPTWLGRYHSITYAQLDEQSDAIARGLTAFGIGKGVRTALMVRPSLELFTLTFGLFKAGAVPVLIDPGIGVKRMGTCLAEAEPEGFIGIPAAHVARLVLGWGKPTVRRLVTAGSWKLWGGVSLNDVLARGRHEDVPELPDTDLNDPAAILFTSGSTGAPKGVEYLHRHFAGQVELIRDTYGIQPGEVDLPTFPLFALFDPALGMTTVIPQMDPTRPARANPEKLRAAIERFGVTNMFGSPALLNTFGRHGKIHHFRIPTLRRVISAGAPVPAQVMERVLSFLPDDAEVVTPYGATECLPVASVGSSELLGPIRQLSEAGAGTCVGRPVPPNEVSIIRITDEAISSWDEVELLPPGEIGEIVVRGPTTTQSYYGRSEATAMAKIAHSDSPICSHRMGDVGYFDDQGRLWFCGRKAHRVQLRDRTLFTVPSELVFNTHPDVFRTALVGVGEGAARRPVLCVELERGVRSARWPTLMQELETIAAQHAHTRCIADFLRHPGFPVDIRHNAKIERGALASWATRELA